MQASAELVLTDEPDAVPQARAFARRAVADAAPALVDNVTLVVTELVTNAYLHGAPPVVLRLLEVDGGVRVEVEDGGRTVPVQMRRSAEAMTGRGLELVGAIARRWGVEPTDDGKVVWVEVSPEDAGDAAFDIDTDALLTAWDDDQLERRYPVRVGAVPTNLLLAAKAHIDNVVRELTLMRGEETTSGVELPAAMSALVTVVTEEFAEARREIKRQALQAAERGDEVTDLVLRLPLSAADAGERYLDALDRADRYARSARLLTLAPPRSHRTFRQWYVGCVIEQLRSQAAGMAPPRATPFSTVLADEVDRLSALEDSWLRLQLLQQITADLTGAPTVDDVARIVAERAGSHTGVETARVFLTTRHRTLRSVAWQGARPSPESDRFDEIPLDADLPGPIVARTGEAIFLRTLAQIRERFPELADYYRTERSLHVVPLTIRGRTLGVLALTFTAGDVTDEAQLAFVRAIADVLAQAMERAQSNERAESERGRELRLLNAQLDVLTDIIAGGSLGDALDVLLRSVEAASPDGMLASVLLIDETGTRLRHCAAPSLPAFYNEAIDGIAIGPQVGSCGTAAYTREQVIVTDVLTDPRWADFRQLASDAELRACWSTPIVGGDGTLLGTFAMYYPQPQHPSGGDLTLIDVLVRTVTLAIERSRADEERERELVAERTAALTLQHSMLPAVPARVGPVRLEARYRTGDPGVQVGGDWFDAIAVPDGTMLVVGDVQGHDLRAAALMGQLRTVARASAIDRRSPSDVLAALHTYLTRLDTDLMATAVVVHLDRAGHAATVASAGHLPPMLMAPTEDGWAATDLEVEVGAPLGVDAGCPERSHALPESAVLLLYTDGLVENRTWPLDHGLGLLRKTLEALPRDVDLAETLDTVLELVPTGSRGDDVAVLAAAVEARG